MPGGCPPAVSRRLAAALRAPLGRVLPPLAALPEPEGAGLRGGYQLLRCAENLELYAALQRPGPRGGPLDLAGLTGSLLAAGREVCRLRPGQLEGGGGPVPLPVVCGAAGLTGVILNLLANSLLYGGAEPRIRLEAWRQGGRAVVRVRDAGPGMAPAVQLRACAPFFSAGGAEGGLGLGLTLAALLARQAGGVFALESRPGRGTAATLALPLCPAASLPPCPTAASLLADRYSPVYVQLCQSCVLPG